MYILEVENLTRIFGGLTAVNEVCIKVKQNEILGLIGPNGAGKTTCFNLITGFIMPTSGRIIFQGKDITFLNMDKLAMRGLVRTFQHTSIFPKMTVFENVLIGTHKMSNKKIFHHIFQPISFRKRESELIQKSLDILDFMGMLEVKDELALNLAYGYQRKLEIAVALVSEPSLLMLDEPAAGMNPSESKDLMRLIKEIKNKGITIILVEHDMKLVMGICDRLVVLNYGSKIAEGKPEEVRQNQQVISVYLGGNYKGCRHEDQEQGGCYA